MQILFTDLNISASDHRIPTTGTRFLNNRFERGDGIRSTQKESTSEVIKTKSYRLPEDAVQAMRLQKETDFLK